MADIRIPMGREELLPEQVQKYVEKWPIVDTVNTALSTIVKQMPDDPLGCLAEAFAKETWSGPRLAGMRLDYSAPICELRFVITAVVQGSRVRLGTVCFDKVLFRELPKEEGGEAEAARTDSKGSKEAEGEEESPSSIANRKGLEQEQYAKVVTFLEDFFDKVFVGLYFFDFVKFHALCAGLSKAPIPLDGYTVDAEQAAVALVDSLLTAFARAFDMSNMEFLKKVLANALETRIADKGVRGMEQRSSPALRSRQDFQAWRSRWARMSVPLFHGGGPSPIRAASLRVCAAFTPFVAGSADAALEAPAECPALGWVGTTVRIAQASVAEGLKVLQADKATAASVVDGIGYATGLVQTVRLARKAAEAAAGGAAEETSGVLIAAAEEAWVEEDGGGAYELETGQKMSLQELVDLYALAAEDNWLRMIVRPFRPDDMDEGCRLLNAARPEVRLVADSAADSEELPVPPGVPERGMPCEAYGCALTLSGPPSAVIETFVDRAIKWRGGNGCGRLLHLDARTAKASKSTIEAAMSLPDTEVLLIPPDLVEEDVLEMSKRVDAMMLAVLFAEESGEAAPDSGGE